MNDDIKAVLHVAKCREFYKGGESALLETIWRYYEGHEAEKDAVIKEKIDMIQPYLQQLSQRRRRVVVARIGDLCAEYERAAFIEGVRVGGRLVMELWDDDKGLHIADNNGQNA